MLLPGNNILCPADIAGALPVLGWIVPAAIVVVGLLMLGLRDLFRFSFTRVWAIGGVCFRESIRRRVLLIIPLAIIGAVAVAQLQKAIDEQDMIRQTTKFCLFAAGMVVVMTLIILGCTNLPREIETRVIYTIVTKPATRLELIAGKIVGFARVSGLILLIMGLFTYGYLQLRSWQQMQLVTTRLDTDPGLSSAERNKLSHYRESGLLTARQYQHAASVEVMGPINPLLPASPNNLPAPDNSVRGIFGDDEEEFCFPMKVDLHRLFTDSEEAEPNDSAGIGKNGLLLGVALRWYRYAPESNDPAHRNDPQPMPEINLDVLDSAGFNLIDTAQTFDPRLPAVNEAHSANLELPKENVYDPAKPFGNPAITWTYIPPSKAAAIFKQPSIAVHVYSNSHNVEIFADASSAFVMFCPPPAVGQFAPPVPAALPADQFIRPDPLPDGRPSPPVVRGRLAPKGGQDLTGKPVNNPYTPLAILHFQGIQLPSGSGGFIPMELNAEIQHGGDLEEKADVGSDLTLYVRPTGGASPALSAPVDLKLENKQTFFADLPVSAMGDGNFDVLLRCNTPGNQIALENTSMSFTSGHEPFAWNLAKSLLILWMLTILVVTLSVLSSTFVSWPIAVVLTVVLLMGHWSVTQVADWSDKTLGRSIATDMGLTDPNKSEAVANTVNTISQTLLVVGAALPDIDRFSAISAIEQGAVISWDEISDGLGVLLAFALPAAVLAYLVLKQKEVAP